MGPLRLWGNFSGGLVIDLQIQDKDFLLPSYGQPVKRYAWIRVWRFDAGELRQMDAYAVDFGWFQIKYNGKNRLYTK
jgi:hypothetical protein